jgi:YfiH family protein
MARIFFTSRSCGDMKTPEARQSLQGSLSINDLVFMEQTHSDVVKVIESGGAQPIADALITTVPGVAIAVLVADCIPLLLSNENVVAAVHVGRKGVLNKIARKTVEAMKVLGAGKISAVIGPSICGKCYEVSPEMYEEITKEVPASATTKDLHALDLKAALIDQLTHLSVEVKDMQLCTLCSATESGKSDYFSYRGGDDFARGAGVICL